MAQATKGGEYGINGEWYNGGEFLPSSPNTIKGEFTRQQIKAQKQHVNLEAVEINNKINALMLEWYPNKTVFQARELYAQYLKENGIKIHNINIYGIDLAKWIL